jgi:hypothetical protein
LRPDFARENAGQVLTDEVPNVLLTRFSNGQRRFHFKRIRLRKHELDAMQSEEDGGTSEGRALAAVAEWAPRLFFQGPTGVP